MDMNEYALEVLARDRLAELRATGGRAIWARAGRRRRRPLRVALGHALIRLGRRLQHRREYALVTIDTGDAKNRACGRQASQPLSRAS
jgi:hypothetical protein